MENNLLTTEDIEILCKPSLYSFTCHYIAFWTDCERIEYLNREHCYYLLTYLYSKWYAYLCDMFNGEHKYQNCNDIVVQCLEEQGIIPPLQ